MYENDTQYTPLAVLAGVDTGAYDMDASMEELRELAASAGYESAGILTQKRPEPDAATCLGAGRLEELAERFALGRGGRSCRAARQFVEGLAAAEAPGY